jgi:hypothetical protein
MPDFMKYPKGQKPVKVKKVSDKGDKKSKRRESRRQKKATIDSKSGESDDDDWMPVVNTRKSSRGQTNVFLLSIWIFLSFLVFVKQID